METDVLQSLVRLLLTDNPTVRNVQSLLGPSELTPMPPNQFLLVSTGGVVDRTEIVLSKDGDESSPVKKLTLRLTDAAGLRQRDLEARFGAATPVDEEHRPAPAAPVRFGSIMDNNKGLEILILARVTRPASPDAKVRSVQFVRSQFEAVR